MLRVRTGACLRSPSQPATERDLCIRAGLLTLTRGMVQHTRRKKISGLQNDNGFSCLIPVAEKRFGGRGRRTLRKRGNILVRKISALEVRQKRSALHTVETIPTSFCASQTNTFATNLVPQRSKPPNSNPERCCPEGH